MHKSGVKRHLPDLEIGVVLVISHEWLSTRKQSSKFTSLKVGKRLAPGLMRF